MQGGCRRGVSLIETLGSLLVLGLLMGLSISVWSDYYARSEGEYLVKSLQALTVRMKDQSSKLWQDSALIYLTKEDYQFFFDKESPYSFYTVIPLKGKVVDERERWTDWYQFSKKEWGGSFLKEKVRLKVGQRERLVSAGIYRFERRRWDVPATGREFYPLNGYLKIIFYPEEVQIVAI